MLQTGNECRSRGSGAQSVLVGGLPLLVWHYRTPPPLGATPGARHGRPRGRGAGRSGLAR